ncbi:MAG: cyclic pyranopterin monophosphate synthase MoaC [Pseudomonadota bacterium]
MGSGDNEGEADRTGDGQGPLTHFDPSGRAHMVDVSAKPDTAREAVAEARISMSQTAYDLMVEGRAGKGDVLGVARLAGIMGAKKTPDLIPLCHPLALAKVAVDLTPDPDLPGVRIVSRVKTRGPTGVEMEALTAATTAALTVYDMLKAVDRGMEVSAVRVTFKDGGRSGRYEAS